MIGIAQCEIENCNSPMSLIKFDLLTRNEQIIWAMES